jgi:hypothetical protein
VNWSGDTPCTLPNSDHQTSQTPRRVSRSCHIFVSIRTKLLSIITSFPLPISQSHLSNLFLLPGVLSLDDASARCTSARSKLSLTESASDPESSARTSCSDTRTISFSLYTNGGVFNTGVPSYLPPAALTISETLRARSSASALVAASAYTRTASSVPLARANERPWRNFWTSLSIWD